MLSNQDGLNTFLLSSGALTVLSLAATWYEQNKKKLIEQKFREKVLSSPETSWKRVAKVSQLFCFPLKSGKAYEIKKCYFSEYGMIADGGIRKIKDRTFIAFEEEKNKFITGRTHPKLLMIRFSYVTQNRVKLEVDKVMPPLEFDVPGEKTNPIPFQMWFGEDVGGIDCGNEVGKWLSRYLIGADSGFRLAVPTTERHRRITQDGWKPHADTYPRIRNEDSGLFSDMASYMILSEDSMNDLNARMEKPITPLQFRPNIVVKGCDPFAEDKWEWIRIGDRAIIRSFKPCVRCVMTTCDPETGIPDPKYEPLKTLRKYRKIKDPALDKLENYAPAFGVYCGLYRTGNVRLGDDVYVYQDPDGNLRKNICEPSNQWYNMLK